MTENLYYYKLQGNMYYYRRESDTALRISSEGELKVVLHGGLFVSGDPICKDKEIIQLYELYEKL